MNIISDRAIEIAALVAADHVRRPVVETWLVRALQRHIRKTPELHERVKMKFQIEEELHRNSRGRGRKAPKDLKEKLFAALDRDEALYIFVDAGTRYERLLADARSVTDWLDAVPEHDRHLRRIDRMSYADASRMAATWHEKLLALSADADDPDVVEEIEVIEDCGDGCRFVELKGPVALLREGRLMGHCVGTYFPAIQAGHARVFSLRDARNQPHVTIEVRRAAKGRQIEASQIKGKGNRVPIEAWAVYCRNFVVSNGWHVSYDGNNIGLVTIAGRTYENPDEILNAMLDTTAPGVLATLRTSTLTRLFERESSVQPILLRRMAEIMPATRKRLFDLLAPKREDLAFGVDETLLRGPKASVIERRHFAVPGSFLQAFTLGYFAGMENAVADALTLLFETMLTSISLEPHHVWEISIKGQPAAAAFVEQIAAYVGMHKDLGELRDRVRTARVERTGLISSAIRREAGRGERGETPPEGGWAHQIAMVERLKPAAVTRMRGNTAFVM
jgi:hypothetical protein